MSEWGKGKTELLPSGSPQHLLGRHLKGDREAFGELIERYQAQVYSYLIRCGVDAASRDDLFQESFFKVHAAAGQYQSERPFEPWFFTIVANTVRSHFRKERVRDLELVVDNSSDCCAPESFCGEHLAQARETSRWLEERLQSLPLAQREVVLMCCFKNLSQQDVASILDLPLNTVKTLLHRGRAALAKALARRHSQLCRETAL